MSSGQPWSMGGLDPKTREIAKDLAYQAGMSLGDWLHQVMREEGLASAAYSPPAYAGPVYSPPGFGHGPFGPTPRELAENADRVAIRLAAIEGRSGQTDQALADLSEKMAQNQDRVTQGLAGFELVLKDLRADQARLEQQVQTLGSDRSATRALTGLRALEGAMSKVVSQMRHDQGQSHSALCQIRNELGRVSDRADQAGALAQSGHALAAQSHSVSKTLALRLEQAEADQTSALARLERTIQQLQDRIHLVQAESQAGGTEASAAMAKRIGALSEDVKAQMQTVRGEMGKLVETQVEQKFDTVNVTLSEVGQYLQSSDKRTGEALDSMASEITRLGTSMDQRLTLAERNRAQAIDRLKGEIFRVIERISERLSHSERRAQQASDDVGNQVARAVDHISERADRSAKDLTERVRQSEDRLAYLLDEARARLDRHLAQQHGKPPRQAQTLMPKSIKNADRVSSIRPDWQDLTVSTTCDASEVFDANDFAFDIQQVDATFANGLDNDTFPDATGADAFEALEQDTWAPSWNKAVL